MKKFGNILFSFFVAGLLLTGAFRLTFALDVFSSPDPFTGIIDHVVANPTSEEYGNPSSPWYTFDVIVDPLTQYVKNVAVAEIQGVSVQALADFTGNPANNKFWYPGVIEDTLISGTGTTPGSIWDETLDFFGTTFTNQLYIPAAADDHYIVQNSINGPISSSGILLWEATETGARFTLRGLVKVPQGFDTTTFRFLLDQSIRVALTNVINHFSTTGTVTYSDELITTPNF